MDLAHIQRDKAIGHWQNLVQEHGHALAQRQQLQQYATETGQRLTQGAQRSTTPVLLHHHSQFMERLQQTMKLQDGVILAAVHKVDVARQAVVAAELRLASLQKLFDKRQAELLQRHNKRDQKQMDEFAAMQFRRQMQSIDDYQEKAHEY